MLIADKRWAVAASLVSMFSVQSGASIAKYLFSLLGPAGTVTVRVGLAGAMLMLLRRPRFRSFTLEQWGYVSFYGIAIGALNLSFYYGVQRIPLGIGVTIEFLGPCTLTLLASRKATDFLWAILAAAGVAFILPWNASGHLDPIGVLFTAVAGVMWALYIVVSGRISTRMDNTEAVTCGMLVATVVTLPFSLISGDLIHLNGKLLALGFCVGLLSSALPFSLDLRAIRCLPAKTFSVLQSLQPAFGALSGLIFLGEKLSAFQWTAVACVIAASCGATICAPAKFDRRQAEKQPIQKEG